MSLSGSSGVRSDLSLVPILGILALPPAVCLPVGLVLGAVGFRERDGARLPFVQLVKRLFHPVGEAGTTSENGKPGKGKPLPCGQARRRARKEVMVYAGDGSAGP